MRNIGVFPYYGGKFHLLPHLLKLFPPHRNFIDLFGGGGCVILNKKPCRGEEIYNDLNGQLSNFFKVISKKPLFDIFLERLEWLPPAGIEQFMAYKKEMLSEALSDIDRAIITFYLLHLSFSGGIDSSSSIGRGTRGERLQNKIKMMKRIHQRFSKIFIENRDFKKCLELHRGDFLVYADPPYLHSTRKEIHSYKEYEMSNSDHEDLINLLIDYEGKVVLSGYNNDLYRRLEDVNWRRIDIPVKITASRFHKNDKRVESIWMNPRCERKGLLF